MDRYRLRGLISLSRGSKDWTLDSFDVNRKYQDAEGAWQLKLFSATTALYCMSDSDFEMEMVSCSIGKGTFLWKTQFLHRIHLKNIVLQRFSVKAQLHPKLAQMPRDPTKRRPFDENNGNAEMAFSFFVHSRLTHLPCMQASVPLSVCLFATRWLFFDFSVEAQLDCCHHYHFRLFDRETSQYLRLAFCLEHCFCLEAVGLTHPLSSMFNNQTAMTIEMTMTHLFDENYSWFTIILHCLTDFEIPALTIQM